MVSIEPLSTLCVTVRISDKVLDAFKKQFSTVHYFPDDQAVPEEVWPEVDVWYARWTGLPEGIVSLDQVKKTKVLQLSSAGVNKVTVAPLFQSKEAKQQIKVCNSSGIHSLSIPQWIVAMIVNLYISTHLTVDYLRNEKKWASRTSIAEKQGIMGQPRYIYGKTIGFLGYGHIARETARVLKCMNAKIIAANSSGSKRLDEGYIIEGTGDKEGVLPEAYYSTNDAKSFNTFLSRCDILVASLPSTPQTQWMLKREHFDLLPKGAIFVNVGRGDLVKSETLIEALDAPNGLFGAALDVTDPEPLPENHALFTHPRAIVTPHVSGDFENYYDAGAELLLSSTEHYLKTGEWLNVVDLDKGY